MEIMPARKRVLPAIDSLPFVKCARTGCINRGIWGLKIRVPLKGTRLFEKAPLECLVNVQVCDTHIEEVRFLDYFTEAVGNQMIDYALRNRHPRPDFRRGYMDAVPINEPEWLAFQERAQQRKPS